jgi:acetylornithine deacetylase/succinyl-diaminopimelate desuccinylase-like protein
MKAAGATRTLLVYAHYDGQPVNPKDWRQPSPFTPRKWSAEKKK